MLQGYFDLKAEALPHAPHHPNRKGQRQKFRREPRVSCRVTRVHGAQRCAYCGTLIYPIRRCRQHELGSTRN